ncbi:MAG: hypothetical protein HN538_08900 [Alphaproteobacteria bacterium]|nr:hypothetical protein [Alphaproteobacteria bacterium]
MQNDPNNAFQLSPLEGHQDLISQFVTAFDENRLHHAWLFSGPEGIGKAKLAQYLAAWLLSRPDDNNLSMFGETAAPSAASVFSLSEDDSDVRLVMSGTHPDLLTLSAESDEKNKSGQIKIEQVRKLPAFFSLSAARAGWRIAIIDSLDDINRNGANAMLKMLEEPPDKTILFVLTSRLGQVLPTIRSRCILAPLSPLSFDESMRVMRQLYPEADEGQLSLLVQLSEGAPGKAQTLAGTGAVDLFEASCTFLASKRAPDADMMAIAEKWGPQGQKAGPMRKAALFLFDKVIAAAALNAAVPSYHATDNQLFTSVPFIQRTVAALAERHSAQFLSSLHQEFIEEINRTERLYLDMGAVMTRFFHKINSQSLS